MSLATNVWVFPGYSFISAFGMRRARSRAASTLATGSCVLFMTSAGTEMTGRICRISISRFIRS